MNNYDFYKKIVIGFLEKFGSVKLGRNVFGHDFNSAVIGRNVDRYLHDVLSTCLFLLFSSDKFSANSLAVLKISEYCKRAAAVPDLPVKFSNCHDPSIDDIMWLIVDTLEEIKRRENIS